MPLFSEHSFPLEMCFYYTTCGGEKTWNMKTRKNMKHEKTLFFCSNSWTPVQLKAHNFFLYNMELNHCTLKY